MEIKNGDIVYDKGLYKIIFICSTVAQDIAMYIPESGVTNTFPNMDKLSAYLAKPVKVVGNIEQNMVNFVEQLKELGE